MNFTVATHSVCPNCGNIVEFIYSESLSTSYTTPGVAEYNCLACQVTQLRYESSEQRFRHSKNKAGKPKKPWVHHLEDLPFLKPVRMKNQHSKPSIGRKVVTLRNIISKQR